MWAIIIGIIIIIELAVIIKILFSILENVELLPKRSPSGI
jgi:hypothetical protein